MFSIFCINWSPRPHFYMGMLRWPNSDRLARCLLGFDFSTRWELVGIDLLWFRVYRAGWKDPNWLDVERTIQLANSE